jgi:hypothetical protein
LGATWLAIFVAMLFGVKIHPRVEQLVTFLCVGWFAYWTLSYLFGNKSETKTEPEKESVPANGNTKKTPKSK